MKGNNKAFLSFNNKSFIENIIDALEDIDKIYISVDEKEKYKSLDFPLIEDEYKDIGPIGGMYSAFKKMNCDFILVLPCDMPRVNKEFVKFLIESIKEDDSSVVLQDSENRLYPLGAVYNRNILPSIFLLSAKSSCKIFSSGKLKHFSYFSNSVLKLFTADFVFSSNSISSLVKVLSLLCVANFVSL